MLKSTYFNPFLTNVPLLYPLKISENRRFSDVLRGYRSGTLVANELIWTLISLLLNFLNVQSMQLLQQLVHLKQIDLEIKFINLDHIGHATKG